MVWLILVGFASGRSTPRLFLTTEIDMIIPDLDCGYEGMMVGISFYFRAGVLSYQFGSQLWKRGGNRTGIARRYMNDIPVTMTPREIREPTVT